MWPWAWAIPVAFLCGSVPFALLIGLAKGVDIRTVGSGNVGATNLGRTLGGKYFAAAFVLDALKGFAPVLTAGLLAGIAGDVRIADQHAWLWLAVAAAAVLGHTFRPWVKFKGGKGVATGLGALLGVFPLLTVPAALALGVFLIVFALWRYVSAASVTAAASMPIFAWYAYALLETQRKRQWAAEWPADLPTPPMPEALSPGSVWPYVIVTGALAILVIVRHKSNLVRLAAGTEPKIGAKKPASNEPQSPSDSDQAPA